MKNKIIKEIKAAAGISDTEKAALLHFDTEFSFPLPRFGNLLEIGCLVHEINPSTLATKPEIFTFTTKFRLDAKAKVSDWVKENQKELVDECSEFSEEQHVEAVQNLKVFLKEQKEKYGLLIPCGYCVSTDVAYLMDILGKDDYELVHYRAIDIASLAIPLFKSIVFGDTEICEKFNLPENKNKHSALDDCKFQAKELLSILKVI